MKRALKSALCLILSAIVLFSCTSVAFAASKITPVIMVHGLGANPVYENVGTKDEKEIAALGLGDAGTIVKNVLTNKGVWTNFLKMMSNDKEPNATEFINSLAEIAKSASVLNCDKNGNLKKGQGVNNYWTDSVAKHKSYYQNATVAESGIVRQLVSTVGASNVYVFNYDWRQDICTTADKLDSYIQKVKKSTGKSKVSLVGCSLGGSVVSAYLDAYKNKKDVDNLVFVNAAFMGVDVARAFSLDLETTPDTLDAYLKCMEVEFDAGAQSGLFKAVRVIGGARIDNLGTYLAKFVKNKNNVKNLYNKVLKVWLGNIPSLWECIPYDSFDKAVKEMSAIGFLDKNSGLYTKIKKYHGVQGRLKSNLTAAKKLGMDIAIFADYGTMGIPITSKVKNQCDALIDTKYASAGATVANYGETLNVKSGKYLSPDKIINAKTCVLPDNTWFIKGAQHMRFKYGTDTAKLVANVACGKVDSTITAVKKKYGFSQFVKIDSSYNFTNV